MNLVSSVLRSASFYRTCARYSTLPSQTILFKHDDMIVCWHPEQHFPYECSLPITVEEAVDNSVLCIGSKEISEVFKKKRQEVIVEELSKMTYTTKHRWYPRSRDKKARRIEPDRPYL